jgi:tetratricopeptide (TPR) repeat protein
MDFQQLYNQARQAQTGGNLMEAARLYGQILAIRPAPEVMVNFANLLAQMGRHGESLAQYDQALNLMPDFFAALYNRGNLLLEMNRVPEALADFDRVTAVRPDMAGAWNNRGTALRRLHRHAEALASYEQAIALARDYLERHPVSRPRRARATAKRGRRK